MVQELAAGRRELCGVCVCSGADFIGEVHFMTDQGIQEPAVRGPGANSLGKGVIGSVAEVAQPWSE